MNKGIAHVCQRKQGGMTLLEVMVALGVFAAAGLAVMNTASEHVRSLSYLQEKTFATWVASNQLTQATLEKRWPGPSWVKGSEEMAGQTWYWQWRGVETLDPNFKALDIEVSLDEKGEVALATARTYVGR
ncbi:type II secretion system minor pseudopilin GspI [Motilimonas eburnea]|uniref:type II secretion system minor pseudopilin GspI n=1 Tax=Motilimonas eburnea TaxID=1737488 RepID=UPI001E5C9861|nr:type II secretion system minor pseudopilin GspI [Motilimonas eburnea]